MGGGYQPPAGDGLGPLIRELTDIKRRLSTLEMPTGTSLNSLVDQVQQAIANIGTSIDAWLNANSYTKAQIDSKVANPGNIAPGNVTASGSMSAAGAVTASGAVSTPGIGTFDGGVVSADVKARTLSVGYDSVYIDASNRMGKSPSARRFKQDIEPLEVPTSAIDDLEPVQFRLIGAVEVMGEDAPIEVGFIAEQLDEIGMGQYVTRDPDGTPHGIAYERLTVPLVAAVQELRRDVAEIRAILAQSQ